MGGQFAGSWERDMRWGAILKSKNQWQFQWKRMNDNFNEKESMTVSMKKNQCWQFQWTRIVAEVATHSTSFVPPKRGSWGLEQEEVKLFIPFSSPIFSSQLNIGSFSSLIFSSQEVDNYVIVLPAAGGRSGVGRRGDEVVWDIRDIYEIYEIYMR